MNRFLINPTTKFIVNAAGINNIISPGRKYLISIFLNCTPVPKHKSMYSKTGNKNKI